MVGSTKILTVSYGTFSCTLEGFDDPFSTMRSIAEYFRDLAADDRYFGAEPATPDADMLHRIAEREVKRRVETRLRGDGVVLRQLDPGEESEAPAAPRQAAPRAAPPASAPETRTEAPEPASAPAPWAEVPAAEAEPAPEPEPQADWQEPVADEPVGEPVDEDPVVAGDDPAENIFGDEEPVAYADRDAAVEEDEAPADHLLEYEEPAEALSAAEDETGDSYAEDEEALANATPEPVAEAPVRSAPPVDDNSVAAKLSRIRAVVSGSAAARPVPRDDRFSGSIDAAFATDPVIEDADFEDVGEPEAAWSTVEEDTGYDDPQVDAGTDEEPGPHPEVAEAEVDLAGEPEDEPLGLAARIVKLKRAAHALSQGDVPLSRDDHPVLAAGDDGAGDPLDEAADDGTEEPVATDTTDDEDGDMRAAIHRIASAGLDEPADDADPGRAPLPDEALNRRPGFDTAKTEDAAFDRILEQTNTRMDDDEGSRRRSAIAHLKAAVAATKADRLLKRVHPEEEEAQEQSRYRDDLAKVVQPRRPVTEPRDLDQADRPVTTPLVLVSEQRVDSAQADDEGVSPHRVTTRDYDLEDMEDDEDFAAFAAKMGATELPDLLEAAAAYTAFVEGNKLFSRPELMRRIAHVETGEEFTREAGLRSFGQLLRQGKIQKLKRGQFTITEETRFNPQARLAGE